MPTWKRRKRGCRWEESAAGKSGGIKQWALGYDKVKVNDA
jgi:hypothetical protein